MFKTKSRQEAVTPIATKAEHPAPADAASWVSELPELILRVVSGQSADGFSGPSDIAAALKEAAAQAARQNEKRLHRTVTYSMNASDGMAASAHATGDVRDIDSQSQEMAAAIDQLNSSISQISDTANRAADTMRRCSELSDSGSRETAKTAEEMSNVDNSVRSASERVDSLVRASSQIGEIVDTISEIASQTNLLALNATIEAARAGEAGRGFAVVASEVKELSTQTAKATDDIRNRIQALQNEVSAILDAMKVSSEAVAAGRAACETATDNVRSSAQEVQHGARMTDEIAQVLNEQRAATDELSQSVAKITDRSKNAHTRMETVIDSIAATEKVIHDQFTDLEDAKVPNYVLHRAKSDHFVWKKNLAAMLVGRKSLTASELPDHHGCRLGKWYDSASSAAFKDLPAFRSLEGPHAEVHAHGKLAVQRFQEGNITGAETAYADMESASVDVVKQLDKLISG